MGEKFLVSNCQELHFTGADLSLKQDRTKQRTMRIPGCVSVATENPSVALLVTGLP